MARKDIFLFFLMSAIWATNFAASKISIANVSMIDAYAARLVVAGVSLAAYAAIAGIRWKDIAMGSFWRNAVIYAFFANVIPGVIVYWSYGTLSTGTVAMLFSATPLVTVFWVAIQRRKHPSITVIIAALIAILGVGLLQDRLGFQWQHALAVLLVLGTNFAYIFGSFSLNAESSTTPRIAALLGAADIIAAFMLLPGVHPAQFTMSNILGIAYLGIVVNSFGNIICGSLFRRAGVEVTMWSDIFIALGAALLGVAIFHEQWSWWKFLGAICIVIGGSYRLFAQSFFRIFKKEPIPSEMLE